MPAKIKISNTGTIWRVRPEFPRKPDPKSLELVKEKKKSFGLCALTDKEKDTLFAEPWYEMWRKVYYRTSR